MTALELEEKITLLKRQIQQMTAQIQQQNPVLTHLAGKVEVYGEWKEDAMKREARPATSSPVPDTAVPAGGAPAE